MVKLERSTAEKEHQANELWLDFQLFRTFKLCLDFPPQRPTGGLGGEPSMPSHRHQFGWRLGVSPHGRAPSNESGRAGQWDAPWEGVEAAHGFWVLLLVPPF